MKKFLKSALVILMLAILIHGWVWIMDRNLTHVRHQQNLQNASHHEKTVKEIRMEIEEKEKKEIEIYGWKNKAEGRARIPVTRAFPYYLHTLSHH